MKMRYDYKCENCGLVEEKLHRITQNPLYRCDECGEAMVRIVTGGAGVVLKGGGWPDKDRRRGDINYDPPIDTSG
jgi:putative FmdB family regulatory protein